MYKFQGIWSQFQLKVFQFSFMLLFTNNALKKKKRKPVFQFFLKLMKKISKLFVFIFKFQNIEKNKYKEIFIGSRKQKHGIWILFTLQRINQLCILLVTLLLIKMMFKHRTIFKLSTLDVKNIKTKFEKYFS